MNSSELVVLQEGPHTLQYSHSSELQLSTEVLEGPGVFYAMATFDVVGIEEDSPDYHLAHDSTISEFEGSRVKASLEAGVIQGA